MGETSAWYDARDSYTAPSGGDEQEGPGDDRVAAALEVLGDSARAMSVPVVME